MFVVIVPEYLRPRKLQLI